MDNWVDVTTKPKCNKKFGESDYLLCYDENTCQQFVAWYNNRSKQWTVAHFKADSTPVTVTHYRKLPPPPKTDNNA